MSKPGDVAGSDVSGIVEQVGANVTNFKKDLVSSFVMGNMSPMSGAFAEYVAAFLKPLLSMIMI